MELVCGSIVTLLILYVLYSECIKLPKLIKQNKKLAYVATIGLYLYWYQNRVEGIGLPGWLLIVLAVVLFLIGLYFFYLLVPGRRSRKQNWMLFIGCVVCWVLCAVCVKSYLGQ